jgi:hypothetical protein
VRSGNQSQLRRYRSSRGRVGFQRGLVATAVVRLKGTNVSLDASRGYAPLSEFLQGCVKSSAFTLGRVST